MIRDRKKSATSTLISSGNSVSKYTGDEPTDGAARVSEVKHGSSGLVRVAGRR